MAIFGICFMLDFWGVIPYIKPPTNGPWPLNTGDSWLPSRICPIPGEQMRTYRHLWKCSISRVEKMYYPGLIPVSPISFACHFGNTHFQDACVYFLGQFSIFCMFLSFRKWMSRGNLHEAFKIQVHLLHTFRWNWVCCPSWGCQCSLGISFRKLRETSCCLSSKIKTAKCTPKKVSDYMPGPLAKDFDSKNTEALSLQQLGHACNSYLLPAFSPPRLPSCPEPRATCHVPTIRKKLHSRHPLDPDSCMISYLSKQKLHKYPASKNCAPSQLLLPFSESNIGGHGPSKRLRGARSDMHCVNAEIDCKCSEFWGSNALFWSFQSSF